MENSSRPNGILVALLGVSCLALCACGSTGTSASKRPGNNPIAELSAVRPPRQQPELASPKIAAAPEVAPSTVAVADFEGGSIPPEQTNAFWGKALANFMIADLARTHSLRLVDREHLMDVLHEQMLSQTGLADPRTRLRVGKILGAKYFIFGTYTIAGGQAALTARMDSVETGQIVQADSVSGSEADMRGLSQQLAIKFIRPLDRVVAEQELHPTVAVSAPPPEAIRYFSEGLANEGRGDYDRAIDMFTRALTIYPNYADARTELEKSSQLAARQQ